MKKPVPAPIELLFARFPALWGFSVRGLADVPDSCARTGDDGELFVSDIGVAPSVSSEQCGELRIGGRGRQGRQAAQRHQGVAQLSGIFLAGVQEHILHDVPQLLALCHGWRYSFTAESSRSFRSARR